MTNSLLRLAISWDAENLGFNATIIIASISKLVLVSLILSYEMFSHLILYKLSSCDLFSYLFYLKENPFLQCYSNLIIQTNRPNF